ncbi:MAG TPA: prolyl oligopeptidase family serine peptidase [Tepidisphaeraceae bacterium]|nr:prolyl oligopeptidase family serine peptidase [Tepidisphaeraceae bacterium]
MLPVTTTTATLVRPVAPAMLPAVRPAPAAPLTTRVGTAADVPFIDALQKRHSKAVGWFPRQQVMAYVSAGNVLLAEESSSERTLNEERRTMNEDKAATAFPFSVHRSAFSVPTGYIIAKDRYKGRDEVGAIHQVNVVPGRQRGLIGAALVAAAFARAAYGCRLFGCWCAQDLGANRFWESLGFVPLAFRTGSRSKKRIHLYWQRRVRGGDASMPWWFPSETCGGAVREDRLVFPIPPGTHWRDVMPTILPTGGAGSCQRPRSPRRSTPADRPRTEEAPLQLRTVAVMLVSMLPSVVSSAARAAGGVTEVRSYTSSVTRDGNGPLDLTFEANYLSAVANAPIMVVMHQYSGTTGLFTQVRDNAQLLRDKGFFVVSVAMRGCEGSDGVRDSGGVEVHDIYDAVQHVKSHYADRVDPTNVAITGYSGGGGNVMSALTKFPDYFRAGAAYFGMSDYGYDAANGWYNNGADVGAMRTAQLNADVGNRNTGGAAVVDRYMARASNLASKNNPYSRIHLFVNEDEAISPPWNSTSYRSNAVAGSAFPGEFDNVRVHLGRAGTYQDFNGNGTNDPDEQQYWPHQDPTLNQQWAGDRWYANGLLSGSLQQPTLNAADELFVAGYVRTKRFALWLGDGQNAAADLGYAFDDAGMRFDMDLLTSDLAVTGRLSFDTAPYTGLNLDVWLNGVRADTFAAGGWYAYDGLRHGDTLEVLVVPEPGMGLLAAAGAAALARRRGSGLMSGSPKGD